MLGSEFLARSDPAYRAGGLAFMLALGAIVVALAAEHVWGLTPCPLCLQQRYAFYAGIPALFAALVLVASDRPKLAGLLFFLISLVFLANAGLALYHAGVEWKYWPGPDTCAQPPGALTPLGGGKGVLWSLEQARVVRCDEAAWRLWGLSFAGWNVIGSFVISMAALQAAFGATARPKHHA
jgi:disulfide bond formation protein DsbB